ncbi:MAG: transglycosylase domain-containing protein [Peptococcaceae bacterium]|nr:transglycosylase domain-containing protein [Peptococcaceae bacterium]
MENIFKGKKNDDIDGGSRKRPGVLKKVLIGIGFLLFLVCLGIGIFIGIAVAESPAFNPDIVSNPKYASTVYDRDGNPIALLSSAENRLFFQYEDIPDLLLQTLVAVEDKRFYKHHGVDYLRLIKGSLSVLVKGETTPSSTISIQLAKNLFTDYEDRTLRNGFKRKIQEIFLAKKIEKTYSKEEILYFYLNHIYFGHGAYGARSAAWVFCGKELDNLTIPDIALLCGLPELPGGCNPYYYPEAATNRRNVVLGIMLNQGLIYPNEYEHAIDEPFTHIINVLAKNVYDGSDIIPRGPGSTTQYPFFIAYVVHCLLNQDNLTSEQIYNGGLHIYTTVDPGIQEKAEIALQDPANFPNAAVDGTQVQGAIVMLDNVTGDIVCMVGGREHTDPFGFNRATDLKRQVGNLAQPLMAWAPALESGEYNTDSILADQPLTIAGWSPRNRDGIYRGHITLRDAARLSVNTCAAKLYIEVGPEFCWNFAKNMGLELANSNPAYFSNAIGAFEATPLEIALAYAAFSNGGLGNEPRCVTRITDANGTLLQEPQVEKRRVMKESTATAISELLRGAVINGIAKAANTDGTPVCGLIGNSNMDYFLDSNHSGYHDLWFAGYNAHYTSTVWMGYDQPDKDHYLNPEDFNLPAALWQQVSAGTMALP